AFLKEQLTASLNGEFVTINSLYEAYQKRVGHPTTKEGFYAILILNKNQKQTSQVFLNHCLLTIGFKIDQSNSRITS
ncbi:hypothetical protein ACTGVV_12710, partial [Streptococcus suis]